MAKKKIKRGEIDGGKVHWNGHAFPIKNKKTSWIDYNSTWCTVDKLFCKFKISHVFKGVINGKAKHELKAIIL